VQETASENHPLWVKVTRGIPLTLEEASSSNTILDNIGGDFTSTKRYVVTAPQSNHYFVSPWDTNNPARRAHYWGPILQPGALSLAFPAFAQSSETDLQKLGTEAVAKCAPTNSVANLATAVTELYRDGLPKLLGASTWKDRITGYREGLRSSGGEYLNVEFGWKPLLADVTDLANGVINLDVLLEQYIRDAGRVVRRRYSFPPIIKREVSVVKDGVSPYFTGDGVNYDFSLVNKGRQIRVRLTTIQRWFSGAFTYHLPPEWRDSMSDRVALARKLLGLNLDADVLWNMTPWTWAVDWFADVGSLVRNSTLFSEDGLVMKYGYIMEHSIVHDTYTFEGPTGIAGGYPGRPSDLSLISEAKVRRTATPFGFGLTGGLTNRQASIVAALSASRVR